MDRFWKEQLIPPSCHFLAKWKSQADTVKDLWAVVELPQKNHSPRKIQFVVIVSAQLTQGMNCLKLAEIKQKTELYFCVQSSHFKDTLI